MLTPIIKLVATLTTAVYAVFGSLFATYVPMLGQVTVVPGGVPVPSTLPMLTVSA